MRGPVESKSCFGSGHIVESIQMTFPEQENAILVGVELEGQKDWPLPESLAELSSLSKTAGASVVDVMTQARSKPDLKYYIGTGKLDLLKTSVLKNSANLVVFDCELNPSQVRNLEDELGVKVIDRTSLILDIFAQHAHSREGKLQVELAQANYNLTHLAGKGVMMSRLGGGIGTRGPGETKLETDRRVIKSRIAYLRKEIEKIREEREVKRVGRRSALLTTIAIVGYTNAGKSTLLNALTGAHVLTEDKLFATLDPTTRRLKLPGGREVLLTDTVGFIHKLPHQLVEAFHATLEEVAESDILLHVVDSSSGFIDDQINAVYRVLEEIKAISKPMITVFNKTDLNAKVPSKLKSRLKPSVLVSAAKGEGLNELLLLIEKQLQKTMTLVRFSVPIDQMEAVHIIHEKGEVKSEKYQEDSVLIEARVSEVTANRLRKFVQA